MRVILLRSMTLTWGLALLFPALYYAVLKLFLKNYHPGKTVSVFTYLPYGWVLMAVVFFLMKRQTVRGKRRLIEVGTPASELGLPGLTEAVRSVLSSEQAPRLTAVGVGGKALIRVTVRGRKISVKIGAPLMLALTPDQLGVVLAAQLAVLDEPDPRLAAALVNRLADLDVTGAGKPKYAARAARMRETAGPFFEELHRRGWERAAGAFGPDFTAWAWSAWRDAVADFGRMETKIRGLVRDHQPMPARFLNAWARAYRYHRPPPGPPALEGLSAEYDRRLSYNDWLYGQAYSMSPPYPTPLDDFDYAWLFA